MDTNTPAAEAPGVSRTTVQIAAEYLVNHIDDGFTIQDVEVVLADARLVGLGQFWVDNLVEVVEVLTARQEVTD